MDIDVKRVYDDHEKQDGYRVLVDRMWPRGLSKEKAAVDEWVRDVAPSDPLRTWFGHRADRFEEFSRRYRAELDAGNGAKELRDLARDHGHLTLLYAARDTQHNQAVVLRDYLG